MRFASVTTSLRCLSAALPRDRSRAATTTPLTFVIACGGFAGVELAGALNDFAHGILVTIRTWPGGLDSDTGPLARTHSSGVERVAGPLCTARWNRAEFVSV